jgi:hypothetical protein
VSELLHFTAAWASAICEGHRVEVREAAQQLGVTVREVDVDEQPDLTRSYAVLNVPAVAITGLPGSLIVGAADANSLVIRLRDQVE